MPDKTENCKLCLQQIQEKIKQLQPKCVVIDYIDLVDVPFNKRGEYEIKNTELRSYIL